LYILSSFHIGQDWDFSEKQAVLTYNAKLANNLWNLVNRVVVLSMKIGWILEVKIEHNSMIDKVLDIYQDFDTYNLKWFLDKIFFILDELNNYTTQKEPWKMIKEVEKTQEVKEVLYVIAEGLRQVWLALYPFFPEKMWEMFHKLWLESYSEKLENGNLKELIDKNEIFIIKEKWEPLFARFDEIL
jgi:methionyl-tRNA synthetase